MQTNPLQKEPMIRFFLTYILDNFRMKKKITNIFFLNVLNFFEKIFEILFLSELIYEFFFLILWTFFFLIKIFFLLKLSETYHFFLNQTEKKLKFFFFQHFSIFFLLCSKVFKFIWNIWNRLNRKKNQMLNFYFWS